jgi:transcriptional regulator with XRE-family HTH domain
MSVADDWTAASGFGAASASVPVTTTDKRPLHRIAEVRHQQGISLRSASRRTGWTIEQVRDQELPESDLLLSDLYRWQQALEVPVANLLVDLDAPLSSPVLTRARMLKLMKTIRALREIAQDEGVQRMAEMLESQLLEVMPELQDVAAWHSVGQRRTQDEMGRIAEQTIPDTFVRDALR